MMTLLAIGFVLGALVMLGVLAILSVMSAGGQAVATSDDYQGD